jgi:hypothetical protein
MNNEIITVTRIGELIAQGIECWLEAGKMEKGLSSFSKIPSSCKRLQGAVDARHRLVQRTNPYVNRPITQQMRCLVTAY